MILPIDHLTNPVGAVVLLQTRLPVWDFDLPRPGGRNKERSECASGGRDAATMRLTVHCHRFDTLVNHLVDQLQATRKLCDLRDDHGVVEALCDEAEAVATEATYRTPSTGHDAGCNDPAHDEPRRTRHGSRLAGQPATRAGYGRDLHHLLERRGPGQAGPLTSRSFNVHPCAHRGHDPAPRRLPARPAEWSRGGTTA